MTAPPSAHASSRTDWRAWHDDYADPSSALSRRLAIVRAHIAAWLDSRPQIPVTVVSACAGQGHDLLGVLAERPDAARVRATLLESDQANVAMARATAAEHGLSGVDVRCVDAGDLASYVGVVPADLVLFAGIFGNVSDDDIAGSIAALPRLCAPGATVIWTRTRKPPDLTPTVRRWFTDAGFDEIAFDALPGILSCVGVHRLRVTPVPLTASPPTTSPLTKFPSTASPPTVLPSSAAPSTARGRLFTFVR